MSPRSASFRSTAVVTPPAVSVKMPVVWASSRMPARISSSRRPSRSSPSERRARSSAYGPSAGFPIASDFAIVSGFTGRQKSLPSPNALRDRRAALGLGAVEHRKRAREEPHLEPLLEPARDLREQRARRDRRDDVARQLEAELLGDLEGDRLRPLRVVRPQVHVHERPVALARQLGAEPVHVVVAAAHGHQVACRTRPWPAPSAPRGRPG